MTAWQSFFTSPNAQGAPPAGLFTLSHLLLFLATSLAVCVALWLSRRMSPAGVRLTVRVSTAVLWAMEIGKILFVLLVTKSTNPNEFVPLYYCSLVLYAGLMSSLGKGVVRYVGDVFLATGSLVGGAVFLLFPTTSLLRYPAFHVMSLHSFLLHGWMVYLALLLLLRGVYRPRPRDLFPCALLVSAVSLSALVFNLIYDRFAAEPVANLMFLSKDFPGTPLSLLYHLCGPFFTPVMWLVQAFAPFFLVLSGYVLARGERGWRTPTGKHTVS